MQYDGATGGGALTSSVGLGKCAYLFTQQCATQEWEHAQTCLSRTLGWVSAARNDSLSNWYTLPAALQAADPSFSAKCSLATAIGMGQQCGSDSGDGDTCWVITVATINTLRDECTAKSAAAGQAYGIDCNHAKTAGLR